MARFYPQMPLTSCHALIRSGDRVLLVKRARPPFEGYWSLPGGSVELGETVEQALHREIGEETSLQVESLRFLGYADAIEWDADGKVRLHYIMLYFEAAVRDESARPGDDASDLRWVSPDEARRELVTDSVLRCLAWVGI